MENNIDFEKITEQAVQYINHKQNVLLERYGDDENEDEANLFRGEVYTDESQLKGKRLKFNINLTTPARMAQRKLHARFIVGYNIRNSHLFYEIWYLPFSGKYALVDKFGKKPDNTRESPKLKDVIDMLFDIVATRDEDKDERELFGKARTASRDAERDFRSNLYASTDSSPDEFVQKLLEANIASRQLLADMINQNVEEYHETKMNKSKVNRLWGVVLGRDITYPTKYIGGVINKALRIIGKDREATFVTGYTFNEKIDIEIWFVKSLLTGKGSFYVFDITSAKLIKKDLRTMRKAYKAVADKLGVDVD
jgi:hypothetical protein